MSLLIGLTIVVHACQSPLAAQPLGQDLTEVAASLQEATLTIRVRREMSEHDLLDEEVEVFTGVAISERWVVAPMLFDANAEIRLTLPDGEQAMARPLAIDEYTGLALLESSHPLENHLELASKDLRVGEWILSAAAWGIERPVISYGMVGGVNRRIAGTNFPPLLLCDLRTAETSSGAPVVNSDGRLVGILISTTRTSRQSWSYAIPVRHLARIITAFENQPAPRLDPNKAIIREDDSTVQGQNETNRERNTNSHGEQIEQKQLKTRTYEFPSFEYFGNPLGLFSGATSRQPMQLPDSREMRLESSTPRTSKQTRFDFESATSENVLVIPHQRPIVGMVLNDDGSGIEVRRLTPQGPAELAGIELGDQIVGIEGIRIRSVYQAVIPTMHLQPGDVIRYDVIRDGKELDISIVLGGGVTLPASSLTLLDDLIEPKLRIQEMDAQLAFLNAQDQEPEEFANQTGTATGAASPAMGPAPTAVNLLQRALQSYQTLIAIQQERLSLQATQREQDQLRIESLEKEILQLKRRLGADTQTRSDK